MTINVIYVAGEGRSGSTLLDRILGSLDGVISVGELFGIWNLGYAQDGRCSCGELVRDCSFWSPIAEDIAARHGGLAELSRLQSQVDRTRHFLQLFTGIQGSAFRDGLKRYRGAMQTLFHAVADHTGADVIIDSSKFPTRALILNEIPGISVHVVHLVRDVRGVIYSRNKRKYDPSRDAEMDRYSPSGTIFAWTLQNVLTELLARQIPYIRVQYEDLVSKPRKSLQELVDKLDPVAGRQLPFVSDDEIELRRIHLVGGNPDRFNDGSTKVRLDNAWMEKLNKGTRRAAGVLAYPLLARYGYHRK